MEVWKIVLVFMTWIPSIQAASKDEWKSRSIYQVVTDRFARSDGSTSASCDPGKGLYCGGTFHGIIEKLDYIQNLGFSAIWISPVTYPIQEVTADLSAYHGYWQQDLYSINPKFGTPNDLKALSHELHSRGMYLMVDVVANNMAWAGNGNTVNYSKLKPFDNEGYYHPLRLLSDDPLNETCVEKCWLGDTVVSLPDLRTEDDKVSSMLYSWIREMVSNYSIDGLRLDSIFNVNKDFWSGFNHAAGVFCLGEGITNNAMTLCPLQNNVDGVLDYPMYYHLTDAFNSTNGNLHYVVEGMNFVKNTCKDIFTLGTFTENQDVPRFASYTQDLSLARNIITYNLLGDGIPVLYYGQEQHLSGASNPLNREALWLTGYRNQSTSLPSLIQSLNRLRSHAAGNGSRFTDPSEPHRDYLTYITLPIHDSDHVLALRKGFAGNQVVSVLSNLGSHPSGDAETSVLLPAEGTGFRPEQNVTEILSCRTLVTDRSGNLRASLEDGGPRVYYPTESLNMSGLCGHHVRVGRVASSESKLSLAATTTMTAAVIRSSGWLIRLGLAVLFAVEVLF